jgi:hypothetical protein
MGTDFASTISRCCTPAKPVENDVREDAMPELGQLDRQLISASRS